MCRVPLSSPLLPAEQILQMQLSLLARIQYDSFSVIYSSEAVRLRSADVNSVSSKSGVVSEQSRGSKADVKTVSRATVSGILTSNDSPECSPCSPLSPGNKRRKKSRDGEKSLEEGSEQLPVTS